MPPSTIGKKLESPHALYEWAETLEASSGGRDTVSVCLGTGCRASGSAEVCEAMREAAADLCPDGKVEIVGTGCHGLCALGPLVVLRPSGLIYHKVTPEDAEEVIEKSVLSGQPVDRLLYRDGDKVCRREEDIPFYRSQKRIALRLNGVIDPGKIEDYVREGGYRAVALALGDRAWFTEYLPNTYGNQG